MRESITQADMVAYGYTWKGMTPLTEEQAIEIWSKDGSVYRLYEDDSEGLVEGGIEEIRDHASRGGIFGIENGLPSDLV